MSNHQRSTPTDLEIALTIAVDGHKQYDDKTGLPDILHPLAVMGLVKSLDEKAVAVLHDVLEDTSYTVDDLEEAGLSQHIIEAVVVLTKKKGERYAEDYLERVMTNPLAWHVKLADNADNMRRSDLGALDEATQIRLKKKYKNARFYLFNRRHAIGQEND